MSQDSGAIVAEFSRTKVGLCVNNVVLLSRVYRLSVLSGLEGNNT